MPLSCSICKHNRRTEIEKSVLAKVSLRHIAAQFGTSTGALQRHRPHLLTALATVHQSREARRHRSVYEEVERGKERAEQLQDICRQMFDEAIKSNDPKSALAAVRAEKEVIGEVRQHVAFRCELERERPDEAEQSAEDLSQQLLAYLRSYIDTTVVTEEAEQADRSNKIESRSQ